MEETSGIVLGQPKHWVATARVFTVSGKHGSNAHTHIALGMKNKSIHFKDELRAQCFILIKLGRQREAQKKNSECERAVCSTKKEGRAFPQRKRQS